MYGLMRASVVPMQGDPVGSAHGWSVECSRQTLTRWPKSLECPRPLDSWSKASVAMGYGNLYSDAFG